MSCCLPICSSVARPRPRSRTNCWGSPRHAHAQGERAGTTGRYDIALLQSSRSSAPARRSSAKCSDSCPVKHLEQRLLRKPVQVGPDSSPCPSPHRPARETSSRRCSCARVRAGCCTCHIPRDSALHHSSPHGAGERPTADIAATASPLDAAAVDAPLKRHLPIVVRKQIRHLIHPHSLQPDASEESSPQAAPRSHIAIFSVPSAPAVANSGTSRFKCRWSYTLTTSRSRIILQQLQIHHKPRSPGRPHPPRSPPACSYAHAHSGSQHRPNTRRFSASDHRLHPVIMRRRKLSLPRQQESLAAPAFFVIPQDESDSALLSCLSFPKGICFWPLFLR